MSDQTYKHEIDLGDFHETDGWYFKRLPNGAVRIRIDGYGEHVMQPFSWASVVAHVSHSGETGQTYQAALDFHQRCPTCGFDFAHTQHTEIGEPIPPNPKTPITEEHCIDETGHQLQ
jgi:hypothetical protein